MKVNTPISDAPITAPEGTPNYYIDSENHVKKLPINKQQTTSDKKFFTSLSRLFGFNKRSGRNNKTEIEFVKVDPSHEMRVAQAKMGKVFKSKMSERLEEYFNAWLNETTDTIGTLQDRFKRIAELEFAINNDPFLGMTVDLIADEATQLDQQDKLIMIDCADSRMKQRMEELLTQWGITQNRVRGAMWNLAAYGDSFWANKVTKNGVVRINPIDVRQVLDRLEFNPVKVASDLTLKQGFLTALSRDERLQMLMDTIEQEANGEFADLFDSKLFGYVIANDFVVPPWNITHFRLQADQSEFAPFGKPMLLKALAPFRQANATMTLQSLARIMNFPVSLYKVKTTAGMDAAQQFEVVEDTREQYENIGVTGSNSETYSVNTKMWAPDGLVDLQVISPNMDLSAIGDLELYQDRVVVSSGVPKGYLVPDWGGFGVSGISLTEQFKPFARKVFTVQSAFLDGLTNLFRLHFAITGEFDYFEPFVLSMKFPNSENNADRVNAKQGSLDLSKSVIDTVADLIGSLNDPLPPEIIQDILTKFSFLDPEDIKKWIKVRATKSQGENLPDESGGGALGGGGSFSGGGGGDSFEGGETGGGEEGDLETGEGSPGIEDIDDGEFEDVDMDTGEGENVPEEGMESEANNEEELIPTEEPEEPTNNRNNRNESYSYFAMSRLSESRYKELSTRYLEASDLIYETVIKRFSLFDEIATGRRHYKYSFIDESTLPMLKVLSETKDGGFKKRPLKEITSDLVKHGAKFVEKLENEKGDAEYKPMSLKSIIDGFMKEENTSDYEIETDDTNVDYNELEQDTTEFSTHVKKTTDLRM